MDEELNHRIRRIYAAIGATEETDLQKLQGTVVKTKTVIGIYQDFSGGLSNVELSNLAHSMIHNIANLPDHLKKWSTDNNLNKKKIDDCVNNSPAVQIIIDLSNNDKHGYPPRDGGKSKKSPRLTNINRLMNLAPKPEKGSFVKMTFSSDGTPNVQGNGSAKAIITGEIVDKEGNKIGELKQIVEEATEALEQLLNELKTKLKEDKKK